MKIVGKSGMAMVSGSLGKEPEAKHVGDRQSLVVKFSLRVSNEKVDGHWKSEYQDVECWGDIAESAQHLQKGDMVFACGFESSREYNGKTYTTVKADFFTTMPRLQDEEDGAYLP